MSITSRAANTSKVYNGMRWLATRCTLRTYTDFGRPSITMPLRCYIPASPLTVSIF